MLEILYEDNHIIVCYKNKGILSQSDGSSKPDMLTMLKAYIKEKYNKPNEVYLGLVHRLDINTSGVMVFARTSKAAARLSDQIRNHIFLKKYIAVVEGNVITKDYIKLESKIIKNEAEKKAYISDVGQDAILEYKSINNYKINDVDVSLLDIKLLSGRFHQIRCQLSSIGHPIYGDTKYNSKHKIEALSFPLQAYSLTFIHPTLKEKMTFEKIEENIYVKTL